MFDDESRVRLSPQALRKLKEYGRESLRKEKAGELCVDHKKPIDLYRPCPVCGLLLDRRRQDIPWHACTNMSEAAIKWRKK